MDLDITVSRKIFPYFKNLRASEKLTWTVSQMNANRWHTVRYMGTGRRQLMLQNELGHFCRRLSFISCNWKAVILNFENSASCKVKQDSMS